MTSNKKRIRLSEIIGPAFYETHKLIDMGVIDEAVEAGGRASLKSSYVGTELVLQLLKHPDCHALVTRQVGDTMRDSVYAQILWAIDKLGLTAKFKCTQSPLQCTYTPTGQRILFRGLDDPQKIKSIKLPFGYIGILWFPLCVLLRHQRRHEEGRDACRWRSHRRSAECCCDGDGR